MSHIKLSSVHFLFFTFLFVLPLQLFAAYYPRTGRQNTRHSYFFYPDHRQLYYPRWPAYYAYYGSPIYGSSYYYSYPLNSNYYYSYQSYYTDYVYPSYPYNGTY